MAVSKTKNRRRSAPTPQEKRQAFLEEAKAAFAKLKAGKSISAREARILQKGHQAYMELHDVFRPTIKGILQQQSEDIAAMLEEAEDNEEYDYDEDEDD